MASLRDRLEICAALSFALALGGCMAESTSSPPATAPASSSPAGTREAVATVRYQVADIERAIAFYTQQLGFRVEQQTGSVFAAVTHGALRLVLSGPGASGSRPMPDGTRQAPGGWNRIILYVDDLASRMRSLQAAQVRFRNDVEVGPGGKQILIEDPDGNPIELHEAPSPR